MLDCPCSLEQANICPHSLHHEREKRMRSIEASLRDIRWTQFIE